jgi:hypothetical protein
VTVPLKPARELTVMVEEPDPPGRIAEGVTSPAVIEKSGTWTSTEILTTLLREPLVPVTFTL